MYKCDFCKYKKGSRDCRAGYYDGCELAIEKMQEYNRQNNSRRNYNYNHNYNHNYNRSKNRYKNR